MNPFYKSLEVIWKNSKFVRINERRLIEAAKEIAKEDLRIPNWRTPVHYSKDDERFVQFIGIVNSINFAFTDFETKKKFKIEFKDSEWRGAFGMVGSLFRAIEDGFNILDAKFLGTISEEKMEYIFRPIHGYPIPMLKERTEIFQEIGRVLLEKYNGSFYSIFEQADFRAFTNDSSIGIVDCLRLNFPSFYDVSPHEKSQTWLQFYKRSQLLVMIYHGRALDSKGKLPLIKDIDDVGAPADYQLPKVLESLGIIEYVPFLKKKISEQQIIEKDSLEEQEIRAMTVLAMKRLLEEINVLREKARQEKINICHLDYRIWKMGRDSNAVHHLTPTIFY